MSMNHMQFQPGLSMPEFIFPFQRLKPSPFRRTDLSPMLYSGNGISLWQSYSLQY